MWLLITIFLVGVVSIIIIIAAVVEELFLGGDRDDYDDY